MVQTPQLGSPAPTLFCVAPLISRITKVLPHTEQGQVRGGESALSPTLSKSHMLPLVGLMVPPGVCMFISPLGQALPRERTASPSDWILSRQGAPFASPRFP